jgi:chromosome segregation ATPase
LEDTVNLIQQHMENVSRELAQLEEQLARLKAEQDETRKLLNNIRRYRKSLNKQYPSSQATLPLAPSPDDDEEEATDEADDADAMHAAYPVVGSIEHHRHTSIDGDLDRPEEYDSDHESLDEEALAKNYEVPPEEPAPAEPKKPVRRRKAKATAEEVIDG